MMHQRHVMLKTRVLEGCWLWSPNKNGIKKYPPNCAANAQLVTRVATYLVLSRPDISVLISIQLSNLVSFCVIVIIAQALQKFESAIICVVYVRTLVTVRVNLQSTTGQHFIFADYLSLLKLRLWDCPRWNISFCFKPNERVFSRVASLILWKTSILRPRHLSSSCCSCTETSEQEGAFTFYWPGRQCEVSELACFRACASTAMELRQSVIQWQLQVCYKTRQLIKHTKHKSNEAQNQNRR